MIMAMFDMPGPAFLALYVVLLFGAILLGMLLPGLLRPQGQMAAVTDAEEVALLSGGPDRLTDSAVSRLLSARALEISGQTSTVTNPSAARTATERAIAVLPAGSGWSRLRKAVAPEAERLQDRLAMKGLLQDSAERARMRLIQTLPYLVLLAIGVTKIITGLSRGKPVGFLVVLVVITAVLAMVRYRAFDVRTRAGKRAMRAMAQEYDRMRRAPVNEETGMAVALFGTMVLAGSGYSAFHTMRTPSPSSSGDSSSSSGCSSSDSGGGSGCGGCGGGGD